MDSEGCPYLDNGMGCNTTQTGQGGARYLVMDIPVDPLYPTGKTHTVTEIMTSYLLSGYFNIKHAFYERFPSGEEKEVACFRFNFKIV
jgi:hypothetical protein